MRKTLHIITACTSRKRVPVPRELHLRRVPLDRAKERFERWWHTLADHRAERVRVRELYSGDHWAVSASLPEIAAAERFDAKLWVASAGYGLISADSLIKPYSATFAGGHPDMVRFSDGGDPTEWWKHLARETNGHLSGPRSVSDLVSETPSAFVLLVASAAYVNAMRDDLVAAKAASNDPSRLVFVSGTEDTVCPELRANVIPCVAKLRRHVGGACHSLHARVARYILSDGELFSNGVHCLRKKLSAVVEKTPELQRAEGERQDDASIKEFIRTEIRKAERPSRTRLLRLFRDQGHACEQGRFKNLYQEAMKMHGTTRSSTK